MFIFDNVCDLDFLSSYKTRIENHFLSQDTPNADYSQWYPLRNIELSINDPIVEVVKNYLETFIKMKTECYEAELQTWPIGICADLHHHRGYGRQQGDFNSLLYLNDDFEGGEFYTNTGITIKPKVNRLTFFNGSRVVHGVKEVKGKHRFTVILWWKNTRFH